MGKERLLSLDTTCREDKQVTREIAAVALEKDKTVAAFDRLLVKAMLKGVGNPPISIRLWNNEEIRPEGASGGERLVIRDRRALYQLILNPELHFGELYSAGRIDVEGDLPALLASIYRAINRPDTAWLSFLIAKWRKRSRRANTLTRARRNIHRHYDIGNDFYQLWLDREYAQYTCAYFPGPDMSLEEAQEAKMHHVCRKLRLRPGLSVVEAGCGWGGFARFMASKYGVKVRAYNISHQQVLHAREKVKSEDIAGQVEYIEDDYRNIHGDYDIFVSIGMLEHVGIENYGELGRVIDRCLKENGAGLIHSIGRNQPGLLNSWIEAKIFPGACPPSLGQMMNILEPLEFSVLDVENLRLHYALTLQHWLSRFEGQQDVVRQMFDEHFVRAWRLYLSGSIAAFTSGQMQLFQVLFTRKHNNDLAMTRAHLYG